MNLDSATSASAKTRFDPKEEEQHTLYGKIQGLSPGNENQARLKAQALEFATQIAHTRWLMFEQKTPRFPRRCWPCWCSG